MYVFLQVHTPCVYATCTCTYVSMVFVHILVHVLVHVQYTSACSMCSYMTCVLTGTSPSQWPLPSVLELKVARTLARRLWWVKTLSFPAFMYMYIHVVIAGRLECESGRSCDLHWHSSTVARETVPVAGVRGEGCVLLLGYRSATFHDEAGGQLEVCVPLWSGPPFRM